jgi:hypothetical protein
MKMFLEPNDIYLHRGDRMETLIKGKTPNERYQSSLFSKLLKNIIDDYVR